MKNPPNFWTEAELDILRENYETGGAGFCEVIIKETFKWSRGRRNVMQKAQKLGIRYKGPVKSIYKKGRTPENKGKKMSKQLYEKCAPTMFKKGHAPHNQKAKGNDISIRIDNRGVPNLHIRLSIGKWEYLSRHTWRSFYGEIPPDHIVIFRDGDSMNCDIKNLQLISRAENARRNVNYEKVKAGHQNLTDEYCLKYMKRYHKITGIDLETARVNGLIDVWREEIRLKRTINSSLKALKK